jgi:hypothetical protein
MLAFKILDFPDDLWKRPSVGNPFIDMIFKMWEKFRITDKETQREFPADHVKARFDPSSLDEYEINPLITFEFSKIFKRFLTQEDDAVLMIMDSDSCFVATKHEKNLYIRNMKFTMAEDQRKHWLMCLKRQHNLSKSTYGQIDAAIDTLGDPVVLLVELSGVAASEQIRFLERGDPTGNPIPPIPDESSDAGDASATGAGTA